MPPATRGLPLVARGRARRGALRAARFQVVDNLELAPALDRAIAEEERLERWLEYVSRRVEAPSVKSFLHRMALEDRDHGRILRRHRNDLEDAPEPIPAGRPALPSHVEIRGELGYYRALLTAVQMKAEAAEYYRKLAPTAENRYIRTFLQILAHREEEQRDILADMLDAQRGIGFGRTFVSYNDTSQTGFPAEFPVLWNTGELLQLTAEIRDASVNCVNPVDVIALGWQMATNELGGTNFSFRGQPGGLLDMAPPQRGDKSHNHLSSRPSCSQRT